MGNSKHKRILAVILAITCMFTFSFSTVFAASSPTGGKTTTTSTTTSKKTPTKAKASDGYIVTKTAKYQHYSNRTANLNKEIKDGKTRDIVQYVSKKGIKYRLVKIKKNSFKGCKKLRKINWYNTYSDFKIEKGAFKGVKTKKIKIYVTKKMSKKQFKKLKKKLKKAGFKGKVKRAKKF